MSATPSDAAAWRAAAFARELQLAERAVAAGEMNHAWRSLELAHIIGQPVLRLHWRAHVRMLVLAWRQRDRREVAAQLARLMLVPLGHLAGRLPGVILANLVPAVPFVTLVMIPFIEQVDQRVEAAARVLGASTLRLFWRILMPMLLPGILAALLLVLVRTIAMFELTFFSSGY